MADKTEMQMKAAEKRLDALERAIESLRKELQAQNVGALPQEVKELKTLRPRIEQLEVLVKNLGVQMVLKKDIDTAKLMTKDQARADGDKVEGKLDKVQEEARRVREYVDKMHELSKREDEALRLRAQAEAETMVKQVAKDSSAEIERVRQMVEKVNVEGRFSLIEGRLKALESRVR